MSNIDKMEALVKELAVAFPGLGLSFGYIGNCGLGYDDRGWRVFTNKRDPKYGLSVSYCLGGSDDVEEACGLGGRMDVVNFVIRNSKGG